MRIVLQFIVLLFIFEGCTFTNNARKTKILSPRTKKPRISSILGNAVKVEHKHFKSWDNEYIKDIKFDIFIDSNGNKIGVQTFEKNNEISKVAAISLDSKLNAIEVTANEWHNNIDVNAILIALNAKKINIALTEYIQSASQEETFIEDESLESIDNKTTIFNEKTIGSNKKIRLVLKNFHDLRNWKKDNLKDALTSFIKSCDVFSSNVNLNLNTKNIYLGSALKWYKACQNIAELKNKKLLKNSNAIRKYFENNFAPIKVYQKQNGNYTDQGTFTGYYELDLAGSREKTEEYRYPIYALPQNCKKNQCLTSKEIAYGKLKGQGLELYWVKSQLELFFMQIQGSGIINFEDGTFARVGFAGTNRRPVSNIFSYMRKECIPNCKSSLNEIKRWFEANPERGQEVLYHSESYVFFRPLTNNGDGAIGAQGIPLTPSRSLAIDDEIIPYGVPIWLDTYIPVKKLDGTFLSMQRLLIAQDTGGAITGGVRGDIFYGHGTKARYLAEKQKFNGSYFILVPQSVIGDIKVY